MVDRSDVIDMLSVSTREEIGPLFANRLIPTDVAVRSAAVFVNIVETIPLAANREFTYFGDQFGLESLPEGATALREMGVGLLAIEDHQGKLLAFCTVLTQDFRNDSSKPILPIQSIGEILSWRSDRQDGLNLDEVQRFYHEYPAFIEETASWFSSGTFLTEVPFPALFHLWQIEDRDPNLVQRKETIKKFIGEFGLPALYPFLTAEYQKDDIDEVIRFALKFQEPNSYVHEQVLDVYRVRESFVETVLEDFAALNSFALRLALAIAGESGDPLPLRDLMLQEARKLLIGTARFANKSGLTESQKDAIREAFLCQGMYLHGLMDENAAIKHNIDYDQMREFFIFHDADDPQTSFLYQALFRQWFKKYSQLQRHADYYDSVEQITEAFYGRYALIENDPRVTTVDSRIEIPRFSRIIDALFPPQAEVEPLRVGFIGMGRGGRVEKYLAEHIRKNHDSARLIGIDLFRPDSVPAFVDDYRVLSIGQLGARLPHEFSLLFAGGSPLMDILRLDQWHGMVRSISDSLKPGGILVVDQAFPYGRHSYQQAVRAYHLRHPGEPDGVFWRSFQMPDGDKAGKPFFAPGPRFMITLFQSGGFSCLNLPRSGRDLNQMLEEVMEDREDKSPIGDQLNPFESPVYNVPSGWRRITYVFRKENDLADKLFWGKS